MNHGQSLSMALREARFQTMRVSVEVLQYMGTHYSNWSACKLPETLKALTLVDNEPDTESLTQLFQGIRLFGDMDLGSCYPEFRKLTLAYVSDESYLDVERDVIREAKGKLQKQGVQFNIQVYSEPD